MNNKQIAQNLIENNNNNIETEMSNLIKNKTTSAQETDLLSSEPNQTNKPFETIQIKNGRSTMDEVGNRDEASTSNNIDVQIVDPRKKAKRKPTNNSTPGHEQQAAEEEGADDDEELVLKYGAEHVIKLFIPVTICLLVVITSLSFITSYQSSGGARLIYAPFNEDSQTSGGTKLWMSLANASIFIGLVVVMTIIFILLYKFECYKILHGWLAFSSLMLLFFFTYMFISEVFKQFNLVTDMITISVFLWNFGIVGMFCIHWKGPLLLQQAFLIFSCMQMALVFIKYLPEWTTWVLLALISIWDLIAVLCPFGPLRILVETAKTRNDNLFPAMVYSSALMYTMMHEQEEETISSLKKTDGENNSGSNLLSANTASINPTGSSSSSRAEGFSEQVETEDNEDGGFNESNKHIPAKNRIANNDKTRVNQSSEKVVARKRNNNNNNNRSSNNERAPELAQVDANSENAETEESNGVKLGLGDFIFYSILVGKASILGDWNTVIACFVAILIGLCMTLVLLAIFHKPLPALPISLFFGLVFYFLTNLVVRPFYDELTYRQYFI